MMEALEPVQEEEIDGGTVFSMDFGGPVPDPVPLGREGLRVLPSEVIQQFCVTKGVPETATGVNMKDTKPATRGFNVPMPPAPICGPPGSGAPDLPPPGHPDDVGGHLGMPECIPKIEGGMPGMPLLPGMPAMPPPMGHIDPSSSGMYNTSQRYNNTKLPAIKLGSGDHHPPGQPTFNPLSAPLPRIEATGVDNVPSVPISVPGIKEETLKVKAPTSFQSMAGLPAKMLELGVSARLSKLDQLSRMREDELSGHQMAEKRRLMRLEKNRRAASISRERKKRYIRSLEERSLIMAKHLAALEMENNHLRQLLANYSGGAVQVPPPLVPPADLGMENVSRPPSSPESAAPESRRGAPERGQPLRKRKRTRSSSANPGPGGGKKSSKKRKQTRIKVQPGNGQMLLTDSKNGLMDDLTPLGEMDISGVAPMEVPMAMHNGHLHNGRMHSGHNGHMHNGLTSMDSGNPAMQWGPPLPEMVGIGSLSSTEPTVKPEPQEPTLPPFPMAPIQLPSSCGDLGLPPLIATTDVQGGVSYTNHMSDIPLPKIEP